MSLTTSISYEIDKKKLCYTFGPMDETRPNSVTTSIVGDGAIPTLFQEVFYVHGHIGT